MEAFRPGPPKFRGVNLAGWLVLETWITPSLFASTGTFDEESLAATVREGRFREILDKHRREFITKMDFEAIAVRGYNAVRLPVPWHLFGAEGPEPSNLPECASYVASALDWAEEYGLRVILDLASVPGMAVAPNGHSIVVAEEGDWRAGALAVVGELARRYGGHPALAAIEPLEEPVVERRRGLRVSGGLPLPILRNHYRDCYALVREVAGPGLVLMLSCAGRPDAWRHFMTSSRFENVWLDVHCYQFDESILLAGPAGLRILAERSKEALEEAERGGLPVVVGEWSAALPVGSATVTPEGRIALERIYASVQMQTFSEARGWFFQTWKTESRLSSWDARIALSSFERGMLN